MTGLVNGDTVTATYATTATPGSSIGGYDIYPVWSDPGTKLGNYTITTNLGTLAIDTAAITVAAADQTRPYGAANPPLTGTLTGVVNGDNITASYSTAATVTSLVGAYNIEPALADPDTKLGNYSVTRTYGTMTVTPAGLTILADNASRAYGNTNPTFTVSFAGFVNSETAAVLGGTLVVTSTATTGSPVGTYPITASGYTSTNYNLTYLPGTLTVTQTVLTVTANNQSRTYGETNPVFTASYSGWKNGEGTGELGGTLALSCTAEASSPVGGYTIVPSGLSAANYSFNYVNGTLTVHPATIMVAADDQSRAYGATNPVFTVSYSGFVNGDTTNVLSGAPELTTSADTNSPAGSYDIVAALGTLSTTNYALQFTNGTLTILPYALIVTADNQSRTYGANNPGFTVSYSGFVNGETVTVLGGALVVTSTATAGSPVGTYPITASGYTSTNYSLSYVAGTLTVTQAFLTVTADSTSRTYGGTNPPLTGTLSGVVNSDNLTASFTTVATAASPVGTYAIVPSFNDPDTRLGNYLVTTNSGTLTVTHALLTVTADNQIRAYGQPNPALTLSYGGWLTATPSLP